MTTLAVTMGDPNGVGPELLWACWRAMRGSDLRLIGVGDPAMIQAAAANETLVVMDSAAQVRSDVLCVIASSSDGAPVRPGVADPEHAPAIIAAIACGVDLALRGAVDALVTMPIAKSVLMARGFPFPGHTEYLADLTANHAMTGPRGPVMMLAGGGLRVALATIHTPLRTVASLLHTQGLVNVGKVVHAALRQNFGIAHPRLALCGLNPHAGEDGKLGDEEATIINPAAALLRAEGIACEDAAPADTLFHPEARLRCDAVIAMYHDQGLIPLKTIAFWDGVNVTLGLPIIRTSPDHGTAFAIAGKGLARADSAIAAIQLARAMAEVRSAR